MTAYGRRLLVGLVAGPMIIGSLLALGAVWASPAPGGSPVAVDAEPSTGSNHDATDVIVDLAVDGAPASTDRLETDGLRPLPPAQGLPDRVANVPGPTSLRIADIRVDGDVVPVGVEADGSLEIPRAREVGWYRFGSNAGEPGSTVLAAHISYDGVDGVFRHLSSVSPGAAVELEVADGAVIDYRVVDVVEYGKAELPVDELFSESGSDRLVLITCGGTFNPRLRTYDSNVVVHAVPAADRQGVQIDGDAT